MQMRVGELARRTGVGVSTLRAWERRFHFLNPDRSPAGHRLYGPADVERVEAVLRLTSEGLTLPAAVARVSSLGTSALPGGEGEELFFGQILRVASQGVWVSRNGRTRYVNPKMAELMGCTADELLTRPVMDFHSQEDQLAVEARGAGVRAGGRLNFTQELRRADGSTFQAEVTTSPLFNHTGQYEGTVAIVDDVTARNEAQAQSLFRNALLDAIGDAVLAAQPDGTIVYANAAAERLLGWRASELIGENGLELLAPHDAIPEAMSFHSSLLAQQRQSGELSLTRRDGTQVVAHVTGASVFDDSRNLVGLIAVLVDSSDRHRIEHELRVQEQQAEVIALLGTDALRCRATNAEVVLTEVVEAVRRVLQCEYSLLVTTGADGHAVRAMSPPYDPDVEPGPIPLGSRSMTGYTARAGKVVIVQDATRDRRFDFAPGSMRVGIRSAIAAPVLAPSGVCAVLFASSTEPSQFDQSSSHFMQNMANVVGFALNSA